MIRKVFIRSNSKLFLSITFLTFLGFVEKFLEEIIENAKVDLGLCFTRFLRGENHDFLTFRNFHTFSPKSEKSALFTKNITFGVKIEKSAVFHENHKK